MTGCRECGVTLGARNKSGYCRAHVNGSPEKRARLSAVMTPELRAQQGRTYSRRYWAWCPPELLEEARGMRDKKIPAEEAKRIILEQHERDMREFRRSLGASA